MVSWQPRPWPQWGRTKPWGHRHRWLAQNGVKVSIWDVNEEEGGALAEEVGGFFHYCDVSDYANVETTLAAAVDLIGPLYATTKYGLLGLTRGVAEANKGSNIRINTICPGVVDTRIVPESMRRAGVEAMPIAVMAAEVVDLLENGANGKTRIKLTEAQPARTVDPIDIRSLFAG